MKVTRPGTDDVPTPVMTLKELLERITHGNVQDEYLRLLAARLSRIYNKCKASERDEFARLAKADMKDIAVGIYDALEADTLPPYIDINELNNERKGLVAAIVNHPDARYYLLILNAGFVTILQPGEDTLISKGFQLRRHKIRLMRLKHISTSIKTRLKPCESYITIKVSRLPTRC